MQLSNDDEGTTPDSATTPDELTPFKTSMSGAFSLSYSISYSISEGLYHGSELPYIVNFSRRI